MIIILIFGIIIILLKMNISLEYKILLHILLLLLIITFLGKSVNTWNYEVNKFTINSYIPDEFKLKSSIYNEQNIKKFKFPFIIKPIICAGTNRGVILINNQKELANFKSNINQTEKYMIQEFYLSNYEVGVLYEKIPYFNEGRIASIVMKEKNVNEWKPLNCDNVKSSGVACFNKKDLITKELEDVIKKISNGIPGFNMGRYDIGFNDISDFKNGKNFKIFELNGVMGFDLLFSLKDFKTNEFYLLARWILVRILTGLINIITGRASIINIINSYNTSYIDYQNCKDWEKWFEPSPA
jgi:hypothetical protein